MRADAPIRVVIVDDNVDVGLCLAELLQYVSDIKLIATFASGEQAIERVRQTEPDVVLMDLRLTGMSGIQCVRKLKEMCPALKIMIFTAHDSDDDVFESLRAGANGYLLKPLRQSVVIEAIRDLFAGGAPLSSAAARRLVTHFHRRPPPSAMVNGNSLSVREQQVLKMLAEGLRYKEIADQLDVSVTTVRTYLGRIYEKLDVTSRTEAVVKYLGSDR